MIFAALEAYSPSSERSPVRTVVRPIRMGSPEADGSWLSWACSVSEASDFTAAVSVSAAADDSVLVPHPATIPAINTANVTANIFFIKIPPYSDVLPLVHIVFRVIVYMTNDNIIYRICQFIYNKSYIFMNFIYYLSYFLCIITFCVIDYTIGIFFIAFLCHIKYNKKRGSPPARPGIFHYSSIV